MTALEVFGLNTSYNPKEISMERVDNKDSQVVFKKFPILLSFKPALIEFSKLTNH